MLCLFLLSRCRRKRTSCPQYLDAGGGHTSGQWTWHSADWSRTWWWGVSLTTRARHYSTKSGSLCRVQHRRTTQTPGYTAHRTLCQGLTSPSGPGDIECLLVLWEHWGVGEEMVDKMALHRPEDVGAGKMADESSLPWGLHRLSWACSGMAGMADTLCCS